MADITYTEWMNLTKKRFHSRSSELKKVDEAFKDFQDKKTASTLQELARRFKIWIDLKNGSGLNSIRNRKQDESGVGPVERLQSLIRTNNISNIAIVRDLQGSIPDRLVMDESLRSSPFDKTKVKETYDRSKLAVELAHKAMKKATGVGAERTLYERWFGTYEAARHQAVLKNYQRLFNLFNSGVIIIHDARQLAGAWGDCFGFAMPGDKQDYVEFTVGRAFFAKTGYNAVPGATPQQRGDAVKLALKNAYANTSDWTVGTMIHELGHAINALPDVDFLPPNTYRVSPGGLTPDGWSQCSTPNLDMALALASPALAIQNTDSYGQCAREALASSGG